MKASNKPFAVIIFGSPGSGKSTQAELIAQKYGMVHFNTGKYIERYIYDPITRNSAGAKKARHEFETGLLVDPSVVLNITTAQINRLARQKESIIFSGSPRTEYETFGTKSKKGVADMLTKTYGKNRVLIFKLDLPEKTAAERNKKRVVCSVCKMPLLGAAMNLKLKKCPFCGGKLYKRSLDTEKIIRERFKEYENRTLPIFAGLRKKGFTIRTISAKPLPYKIFTHISKKIDSLLD
ncbi:hypothetical protein A2755_01825 [Candidatus Wolfebacteria bacterium RIFCSPHIGHO2_01_FULL_48_22]|uniref:Adenylate kinase n=2 Tax=Candidatus Wolfeibacteriota TaxID=1752735 RepID=A0A1F8DR53_9BACT|nr:MAG: hypothetical protein A2755_01825 [Candidatus Wolfebacteria bacterium RIFCSPHIGHO2_01_FULL_48_22]OGM91973.1 MAG: hypothetical protein A2935_02465 [Candidatus Wolfebacteria bacterium RIFCSPLOWO2_01_FULL_47_17b]